MKSIRRDLIAVLVVGTGLILAISGVMLYALVQRNLIDTFDETTVVKASAVAAMLELSREGLNIELEDQSSEFEPGADAAYFQMWLEDGQTLYRSPSLAEHSLSLPEADSEEVHRFELTLPDGRWGRAVWLLVEPELDLDDDEEEEAAANSTAKTRAELLGFEPPRIQLVVARSAEEVRASLGLIRAGLLLAGGLSGIAIVGLLLWAIPKRLRPVIELGNQVQNIDANTLSARLQEQDLPAELQELPKKINELLARLEASFDRERRMTANLAHDLRTPLAELRSAVEISRRWPEDRELNEHALETAQSASLQMTTLVTALLKLARIEANQSKPEVESVALGDLVNQLWSTLVGVADERRITLVEQIPAGVLVRTDRALLSLVLINLLENAVKYSPPQSVIRCSGHVDREDFVCRLTNPGPELQREDLAKLAEPFWQKDAARASRGSAGLGLTLAQSIVAALDLGLELSVEKGEFAATLRFPRQASALDLSAVATKPKPSIVRHDA